MGEHKQQSVIPEQSQQTISSRHKRSKAYLMTIIVAVILIVAAAYGAYAWQHSKLTNANLKVTSLQTQLSSANRQNKSSQSTSTSTQSSSLFTYKPSLGGLSVTLSKAYDVLVGSDGNDGGTPGVDFKVVPLDNSNISNDWDYTDEAEIQIGGFSSLSDSVSSAEAQMQQNGDCSTLGDDSCDTTNFSVSDTTIDGQPAKLIIAQAANEYLGMVNVYVGGLGQWGYTITSNNTTQPSNNTPGTLLSAVLKGINLKQANWP